MSTLTLNKETALQYYKITDAAGRKHLETLFGKEAFIGKITDHVKTLDDIWKLAGKDALKKLPYKNTSDADEKYVNAAYTIMIIARVLNEGHVFDWDNSEEYKYFPVFDMRSSKSGSFSGFAFAGSLDGWAHTAANGGSRVCFKSRQLSDFAGQTFPDVYKDFIMQPKG